MIKVKILDILDEKERNLNWLATNAKITYSTLYNFAHQNTNSVTYDILEKLCITLRCDVKDIIEYIPTGVDILPESSLEALENAVNVLINDPNIENSNETEQFLIELFIKVFEQDTLTKIDTSKLADLLVKCIKYKLIAVENINKIKKPK